jgi:hypothetical protein
LPSAHAATPALGEQVTPADGGLAGSLTIGCLRLSTLVVAVAPTAPASQAPHRPSGDVLNGSGW